MLFDHIPASSRACVLVCCSACLQAASCNNRISKKPGNRRALAEAANFVQEGMLIFYTGWTAVAKACDGKMNGKAGRGKQRKGQRRAFKPCTGVQLRRCQGSS